MADTNIQDRDIFDSFEAIVEDLVNCNRKKEFLSRGYILDDDDGRTTEMNKFTEGKILDLMLVCSCIGRHTHFTPAMISQDTQRYNEKQNMTSRKMQTLIFPAEVVTEMNNTDIIHHRH